MSNKFRFALLATLALGMGACTPKSTPDDPKARITEYISKSFAVRNVEDRKELLGFLTGDARTRLASWSDEQFREAFVESKRQFVKLAFREVKPVNANEVSVTYELTYLDQAKGRDARVTNKKLAQLIKDQGHWMISGVQNLKELVEYQNEVSLP